MKRYRLLKNRLLAVAVVLTVCSCSDDLERYPYSSIEQSQSFKTIADAKNWDVGFYSYFRGLVSGNIQFVPDVQADQLNASRDFGNRNGFPHRWEGFLAADGTIADIWARLYSAITNVNVAIAGFETLDIEDQAAIVKLNTYKGDAHFARAYYYHQLILRYAKAYDPSTAASDLGVPLVLEYNVNAQPSRNTIKEVYDQILKDLDIAGQYLSNVPGKKGATTFNKDVVKALKARVLLHMRSPEAKTVADDLINSGTYPLMNTETLLKDMWKNDNSQEVIFQPFVQAPDQLVNANVIYLGYNPSEDDYTPDFIPSQWVVDMYDDNDIRKAVYFDKKEVRVMGITFPNIYLVNKYPGNPNLFTGANTNYQNAPKVFRIAEMYLISAEAGAMASGDAQTPLSALRIARGLPAIANPTLQDVKDERFRELAFEGFRLDDLKRWGEGFERKDPQNEDLILTGPNYETLSKPVSDPKFIWAIPERDVTVNPNLKGEQNPGW
ncbi:RagB/SusD family nutrient uptake outer membrane protein [Gelidibacter japonicus]|uniref:RagB/SusD family nutrient uptake outer membrane protein n=1 Tax=Gelidibacter japonicus TaxID=1962232 RepID=UPI003A9469E1